jgi:Holliday junction resolvase RusA-like endonuclease
MSYLMFFVPGAVSAQGSKRHVGRGVLMDMNKGLQPWRDSITHAARKAAQDELNWRDNHGPVFVGPVRVTLAATYSRPKSHYGSGRNAAVLRANAPRFKTSAPDIDKVARAALDAITASGVWKDDAQVSILVANKTYADQHTPGLTVQIDGDFA